MNINEYIWIFCINYIRVNIVTRPAEYLILQCNNAVMNGFGEATFFILLDAYSGYHQVKLSEASAIKTAFFAPHERKYCWVVMPFGLRNCPAVFIAMMHDLQELWIEIARKEGIDMGLSNGTTIIMDGTFLFGVNIEASFVLARCVCLIARKYHLTWKLKKLQWMAPSIEFVGKFERRQYPSPVKGHHTIKLEGPFNSKTCLGICRICHLLSRMVPLV